MTNDDLALIVDTSDEWIRSRTGIRNRRISDGAGTAYMAAEAAKRALENAGVSAEEIDLIILGTSTPDCCFPSGACEVQAQIGAVNAVGFDVSAACAGFLFALSTAYGFMTAGMYKTALVIGADALSKIVDWNDRSTCVLFGDGAGAVVVKAEDSMDRGQDVSREIDDKEGRNSQSGIIHMVMGSDGTKGPVLSCQSRTMGNFLMGTKPEVGYISMDGQEVFKFAVKKVPETIDRVLNESGMGKEDVKYFVLHQANYRICEAIAKRMKLPIEHFPMNIQDYGNTSAATVPILLDQLNRDGKLDKGDLLVLAGFGAGLTWGATLMRW